MARQLPYEARLEDSQVTDRDDTGALRVLNTKNENSQLVLLEIAVALAVIYPGIEKECNV